MKLKKVKKKSFKQLQLEAKKYAINLIKKIEQAHKNASKSNQHFGGVK